MQLFQDWVGFVSTGFQQREKVGRFDGSENRWISGYTIVAQMLPNTGLGSSGESRWSRVLCAQDRGAAPLPLENGALCQISFSIIFQLPAAQISINAAVPAS